MAFFDNLFGKKPNPPEVKPLPPLPTTASKPPPVPSIPPPPPIDDRPIKVFDAYGREVTFPREVWRTQILPGQLRQDWNKPDDLANCITQGLRDGFAAEVLPAARRLQQIDTNPARAVVLLGVTLLQLQNFKEADFVLTMGATHFPKDGLILINCAKARAGLGQETMVDRLLWRAFESDPNLDNGLLWYIARERERGGDGAEKEALLRVAALPNSWRAPLWLARLALQKENDLPAAMGYYQNALQQLEVVPTDVLMQISGDLGNAGHIMELLELCTPRFDPKAHGLSVGNNLIKAYVDTGQAGPARQILDQLYAQQRPDWKDMLLYWDKEIDQIDKDYGPMKPGTQPELSMLFLEAPVWARKGTPFAEILPAKEEAALKIAFLAGSVELPAERKVDKVTAGPTDAEGRLSRAMPLFLAEQVHLRTDSSGLVLVPWLANGGFAVAGMPWDMSSPGVIPPGVHYIIALHLIASASPWRAVFTLARAIDSAVLATWEEPFEIGQPAPAIERILSSTLAHLLAHAEVKAGPQSEWIFPPSDKWLASYLVGLEQAMAVTCAKLVPDRNFLTAERSIIENHLNLCIEEPQNVCCRFLLLDTLEKEAARRPDIAVEFKERIQRLQVERPLAEPAQALANARVAAIFPQG